MGSSPRQDKKAVLCRQDWHQTSSQVVVTVYAKNPLPALSSVKANRTMVSALGVCSLMAHLSLQTLAARCSLVACLSCQPAIPELRAWWLHCCICPAALAFSSHEWICWP